MDKTPKSELDDILAQLTVIAGIWGQELPMLALRDLIRKAYYLGKTEANRDKVPNSGRN